MDRQETPHDVSAGPAPQDPTTGRLETFSDGVIAIAITLLILEIKVPHPAVGQSLGHALAQEWPSFAAYVVSFLTIGIMWVNHHHMFTLIGRANHTFLMLNVVFLLFIAAVPFPTAIVADHLRNADGRSVAAVAYGVNMVAIAVMFNAVWRYAARGRRLLAEDADPEAVEQINRSYFLGPLAYGLATILALVTPVISLVMFAALAIFYMLPLPGQGRVASKVRRR
jgi:uncharacterized membrane protein